MQAHIDKAHSDEGTKKLVSDRYDDAQAAAGDQNARFRVKQRKQAVAYKDYEETLTILEDWENKNPGEVNEYAEEVVDAAISHLDSQ